jgi:hypothetical protein
MTRKGGVRRDGPADHIHASHHNSTGVCYANRSGMHLDLAEVEGGVPTTVVQTNKEMRASDVDNLKPLPPSNEHNQCLDQVG